MTGDLRQRKTWNRIMERIQPGICWRGHRTGLGRNSKPFIYIDKLTNVSNPCLSHLQNGRKGVLRRLLFRIARDKNEIAGLLGALLLECACGQARRLWRGGGEGWGCAHSPCPRLSGKRPVRKKCEEIKEVATPASAEGRWPWAVWLQLRLYQVRLPEASRAQMLCLGLGSPSSWYPDRDPSAWPVSSALLSRYLCTPSFSGGRRRLKKYH